MARYVEFETDGGTILVEVEETSEEIAYRSGVVKAGRTEEKVEETIAKVQTKFDDAVDVVRRNANTFIHKLRSLSDPPDEVEITFGLKVVGEVGNFAVAKAGAEANYAVKLTWKQE